MGCLSQGLRFVLQARDTQINGCAYGGIKMSFKVTVDKAKCSGDAECVDVCPVDVYELVEGKAEPVNEDECLGCESCIEVCEQDAITVEEV